MAFSRPLIFEEHLLRGVAPELDDNRADGHQLMDIDDGEDWSDGADSGYGSMTEDEEDLDVEDVRYRSPLVQQLHPDGFWEDWRRMCPLVPSGTPLAAPVPAPMPDAVPVSPSLEESAPSMSGLSYPTKRSREENHTEQVSMKRLRRNGEEESAPSVSGLSFFANGSSEDDYRNSAPSTSGLGFFAGRRHWPDAFGYRRWAEDGDSD
ncbi:uncharacterized protein LOC108901749 isoform X1 [Lates calcarifer]|uniref:Uncharacterized protein LOC108901749 isoform X1 n=1 Tax=Lates calcarifer TaxID=8187 RepID=A0AAJ7QL70_LATCA|nr:uncharacterized protein LOC108901749 isoform X1 [Lates calcarifer]